MSNARVESLGTEILFQDGFQLRLLNCNPSWKRISVRRNPFLDFAFYWEIQNPKSEIEIRISQSNAPIVLLIKAYCFLKFSLPSPSWLLKLPNIFRHSKSNVRKSNSIELNRTQSMDWVRLSSAIERNRTPDFQWVRFPNKSNSIEQIEPNRTQSIRLGSIGFGNRTNSNTIKWIAFDWLW